MKEAIEIWKDIPNYEGYQVSNLGRIKSLERIDAIGHRLKEKILKPQLNSRYYQASMFVQAINCKALLCSSSCLGSI